MIEAHLLDFEGDLYGRRLRVLFVDRLRDEQTFSGVHELRAQIGADAAEARRLLALP
jgi:riboflavin kinase/FMN adenylyltransferase